MSYDVQRCKDMSVKLTCCRKCAANQPAIQDTIEQLQQEYPEDLRVVQVKCMAACRHAPSIMVDYDFYPNVTPQELYERTVEKLALETSLVTEQVDVTFS